jgi:hypothetical protein
MSSEGFSALGKNAVIWPQRALLPTPQSGITAFADRNSRLRNFFEFELAGSGVGARCRNKKEVVRKSRYS